MMKREAGITIIALVVTIVVLMILAGITVASLNSDDSSIKQTQEAKAMAEKESLLEKIEADIFTEKMKKGTELTEQDLVTLIENKGYGTVSGEAGNKMVTAKEGGYTISFSEIIGWKK